MAETITGYSADEVVDSHCHDNILGHVDEMGNALCQLGCPLVTAIGDEKAYEAEVFLQHRKGHHVPVRVKVTPIRDRSGEVVGAVELFSDNSATVATLGRVKELEQLAMIDTLTKIPNRRYLDESLEARSAELRRTGAGLGVAMIDIDRFKNINDKHGHHIGDEVLKGCGLNPFGQHTPVRRRRPLGGRGVRGPDPGGRLREGTCDRITPTCAGRSVGVSLR